MSRFATVDYALPDIEFATWERCEGCSGRPQPGAQALLAYWLEQAPALAVELGIDPDSVDARSLGIYNCRPVRGRSSLSIHACGRAADLGIAVSVAGHRVMVEFLSRLAPHAKSLGIQLAIFSRLSGSARYPWPNRYDGTHPHDDHAHVELNEVAAEALTLATLRDRCGDARQDDPAQPTPPPPPPSPPADWRQEIIDSMDTVNLSSVTRNRTTFVRSPASTIKRLQSLLAAAGYPPANSFDNRGNPDGVGGRHTRVALEAFQRSARTGVPSAPSTPDAIVGEATWTALLGR